MRPYVEPTVCAVCGSPALRAPWGPVWCAACWRHYENASEAEIALRRRGGEVASSPEPVRVAGDHAARVPVGVSE